MTPSDAVETSSETTVPRQLSEPDPLPGPDPLPSALSKLQAPPAAVDVSVKENDDKGQASNQDPSEPVRPLKVAQSAYPGGDFPASVRALQMVSAIMSMRGWMNRRVDTYAFSSARRMRQKTSLDFTLSDELMRAFARPNGAGLTIPLQYVTKLPLMSFDVGDESGADVPILRSRESGLDAALGMLALANVILEGEEGTRPLTRRLTGTYLKQTEPLPDGAIFVIENHLQPYEGTQDASHQGGAIHSGTEDYVAKLLQAQLSILCLVTGSMARGQRELAHIEAMADDTSHPLARLWGDEEYRTLLRRFAHGYYLTALLPVRESSGSLEMAGEVGRRRVLTVEYEHVVRGRGLQNRTIQDHAAEGGNFLRRVGGVLHAAAQYATLVPFVIQQDANAAVDAASYHIEVEAPPGLKVVDSQWLLRPPGRVGNGAGRSQATTLKDVVIAHFGTDFISTRPSRGQGEHGRWHTRIPGARSAYALSYYWRIAPLATGWLFPAMLVCLLELGTQVVLFGHWLELPALGNEAGWLKDGWASLQRASLLDVGSTDPWTVMVSQSRLAFVVGVMAVAITALVRAGEHPVLKFLMLGPRLAVVAATMSLAISASPLLVGRSQLTLLPLAGSPGLLEVSLAATLYLAWCLTMAVGVGRKVARAWGRFRRSERPDWKVWK